MWPAGGRRADSGGLVKLTRGKVVVFAAELRAQGTAVGCAAGDGEVTAKAVRSIVNSIPAVWAAETPINSLRFLTF
ncbi:MAG: hypothetical protein EA358_09895 [Flavobacteriales bacterium]|nr:MAG: hypothetical protein EA358_09895 [Flavobacteriales bacterium]